MHVRVGIGVCGTTHERSFLFMVVMRDCVNGIIEVRKKLLEYAGQLIMKDRHMSGGRRVMWEQRDGWCLVDTSR